MQFAYSPVALWRANFRDLNSSITRMATLSTGGRITEEIVAGEIIRLQHAWSGFAGAARQKECIQQCLTQEQINALDLFDRMQLNAVIEICLNSSSLAEAGRSLFNASRTQKSSSNDSHRLKQYLAKFGLDFSQLKNKLP